MTSFLNVPNFRHFEDVVFNIRIHSQLNYLSIYLLIIFYLFTSPLSCLSSSLLPSAFIVCLVAREEAIFVESACALSFPCVSSH